ncbi:MAG: hypothetical protein JXB47_15945 [Anaerolineae bacterium]|nr:hypothetical protein [Anaerolineae bacterium]
MNEVYCVPCHDTARIESVKKDAGREAIVDSMIAKMEGAGKQAPTEGECAAIINHLSE